MMTFLRKHRGWLMIVIIVLSLPFLFYFVKTDYSRLGSDKIVTIYGRGYNLAQLQRNVRLMQLAEALGAENLTHSLGGATEDPNRAANNFALNLVILEEESDRLGIAPSDADKADFIRNLSGLRGPNGYDPQKYREFSENILPSNGFTEAQIEELASYALSLNRVKDLVTAGVSVPESETKANYDERYGKLFVHAIRVHASDFLKDVKLTDDEIRKYYDAHKNAYQTEEKRKVDLISLALSDDQKKLQGKEHVDALQKLADRANDVSQALAEKDAKFAEVGAKFQVPVKTTGEFTAAAPDPLLKADPQLSAAAFQLSEKDPISDILQAPDGFYILHLAGITPSRPLTFEEAKDKVVSDMKSSRTREMAMNKGRTAVQELRDTMKTGAPLKFALEKSNVKDEVIAPFTLMEAFDFSAADAQKNKPKDFTAIANAAAQTPPGEFSDFFPWEDGGIIVYVEKREPPDPAKYQQEKAGFADTILRNKRDIVFSEWLGERQRTQVVAVNRASENQGSASQRGGPVRAPAPQGPPSSDKKS